MLTAHQKNWKVDQWVAYLKVQDIPIMPRSRYLILAMAEGGDQLSSPKELARIVTGDPFLALRSLRYAEARRSRRLGSDTTTPMASLMQIGVDGLLEIARDSPLCDDSLVGLVECEFSSASASYIARAWSAHRADVSPDEIALAALLADIGEMMLWHFATEIPECVQGEAKSGRALSQLQAQLQGAGFSFKALSLALAEAWALPPLITQLIRGVDSVRANIARLASATAKHIQTNPENPALPSDIISVRDFVPASSYRSLLAPLPISDEFREAVLKAVTTEVE